MARSLGKSNPVTSEMPEKVKELEGRLLAHLKSVGAKMPKLNPAAKKLN